MRVANRAILNFALPKGKIPGAALSMVLLLILVVDPIAAQDATPEPPPYEIDAPSSLTANMTAHGNTRVLHLVNWTGCKLEQPQQKVYHIPPIEDVTIRYRIPPGKSVRKVSLFIPAAFGRTHKKDTLQITLPRIEDYQAVVFKMEYTRTLHPLFSMERVRRKCETINKSVKS